MTRLWADAFSLPFPHARQAFHSGATFRWARTSSCRVLLNRQTNADQADETTGIVSRFSASQTTFTAAISDVRPEDAKFEVDRILATYAVSGTGLGYGNPANTTCFQPPDSWTVSDVLGCRFTAPGAAGRFQYSTPSGHRPFSHWPAWKYRTIEVGAEPIIFMYNASNPNGLGALGPDGNVAFKNLNRFTAVDAFNGTLGRAQDLDLSLTLALQGISSNPPISLSCASLFRAP